jgi:hypothetical protein
MKEKFRSNIRAGKLDGLEIERSQLRSGFRSLWNQLISRDVCDA